VLLQLLHPVDLLEHVHEVQRGLWRMTTTKMVEQVGKVLSIINHLRTGFVLVEGREQMRPGHALEPVLVEHQLALVVLELRNLLQYVQALLHPEYVIRNLCAKVAGNG
jgi:hypothetical protein